MEADDWVKLLAGIAVTQVVALIVAGISCYVKLAVLETTVKAMQACLLEYDVTHEKIKADLAKQSSDLWREISKLRERLSKIEPRSRRHESANGDESCG